MAWYIPIQQWLAHAALGGFLFLGLGCLAVRFCRQPVRQLRLIELTLLGCLLLPWLALAPALPHFSLGWLNVDQPHPTARPISLEDNVSTQSLEGTPPDAPVASGAKTLIAAKKTNEEGAGQVQPIRMAAPPKQAGSSIQAGSAPQPPSTSFLPASEAEHSGAWSLETPALLVVGYGAIVAGFFVWWLAGVVQLLRLKHSTYPVTEAVAELFRSIAGPAGERVRLVVSDWIELPLTYSSWRPVIGQLMPVGRCSRLALLPRS